MFTEPFSSKIRFAVQAQLLLNTNHGAVDPAELLDALVQDYNRKFCESVTAYPTVFEDVLKLYALPPPSMVAP